MVQPFVNDILLLYYVHNGKYAEELKLCWLGLECLVQKKNPLLFHASSHIACISYQATLQFEAAKNKMIRKKLKISIFKPYSAKKY